MRKVLYILSLCLVCAFFIYSVSGSLGTAVSYKFEVEDPTVEMGIGELPQSKRTIAKDQLEEKKNRLEWQELGFNALIIGSITALGLLLYFRKRILERPAKQVESKSR
jgi:hypothetical protein